jgi:hypothetical protein
MIVFLFQCCKVYDKQPVTLDKALKVNTIKIVTFDDRQLYFDKIYYKDDSILYGLIINKSEKIETIIPIESIKEIYQYNAKKSTTAAAFLGIGIFVGIIVIVATTITFSL